MEKAEIENKQPTRYKIIKSIGVKISLKKEDTSEEGTLPLKDATSKENRGNLSEDPSSCSETNKDATSKENRGNLSEDPSSCSETNKNKISKKKKRRKKKTTHDKENEGTKENLCETTCSNETNKINISSKEMRSNEETNCDEASEKMTVNPEISYHKIYHSEGKEVTKEVSISEIVEYCQNKIELSTPKEPAYDIVPYDENLISGPVTVYGLAVGSNEDNTDKKIYVKKTTYHKTNKSENPVKEKSSHETSTSDEANKSQNPIKEESSYETSTCDEANKSQNPVKEESSHETSTCDEANKSQSPIKEESSYETSTCDEANKNQNPVKEESSHKTSTCDKANKSQNPVKEESSHETSTCDEANKSKNLDKGESSHETTTCDERNKNEIPAREEPPQKITSDEKNDGKEIQNDSSNMEMKYSKNILRGAKVPYNKTYKIGFHILRTLQENPEFIGQVDVTTGEKVTFQQMRENSVKCALLLKALFIYNNIVPIVTICTRNPMVEYIPYLAALYVGATVCPWEEEYFSAGVRVHYFLVRHRPGIIFVDDHNALQLQETIDSLKNKQGLPYEPIIIVFNKKEGFLSLEQILAHEVEKKIIDEFLIESDTNAPAIMMFSSNAAQFPNDVILPYLPFISPCMHVLEMKYGEIGLWYGSLCWTHSLFLTTNAIISRTTALKCPKSLFNEEHLYQTIAKYKVTWIFLESSMCNKMCLTNFMVDIYDISSLKTFLFGDTPIEEGIHEDFILYMINVSVMQVYCDALAGVIAYQRDSGPLRCSGHVNCNVLVKIVDIDTGYEMGPNGRGEIWCQTPCTPYSGSIQYISHQIFVVDTRDQEWYRTGDYGFYDDNDEIYIIDRVKHLIRYRGTIVSAAEIEAVLLRHVAVAEVAVLPIQNANDGQHPVAFVRKVLGLKVTEMELKNYVAQRMDDNCNLRGGVYFVDRFKYLPNGKIDRERLLYDGKYSENKAIFAKIGNRVMEI